MSKFDDEFFEIMLFPFENKNCLHFINNFAVFWFVLIRARTNYFKKAPKTLQNNSKSNKKSIFHSKLGKNSNISCVESRNHFLH